MTSLRSSSRFSLFLEHDLGRKPVPTFRDHARVLSDRHPMTAFSKPARWFAVVRAGGPGFDPPGLARLLGGVVVMGNFDGVPRGHQAVGAAALERARGLKRPAAAVTFEPHPRLVL